MLGRAFDYVAHLFARDNEEFIGWHGTNSVCLIRRFVGACTADS